VHHLPLTALSGDGGDFLTAIVTRGLAHPSGYPTYVILGIFATFLPLATTVAFKVGLLNAFLASLTICVLFLFLYNVTKSKFISVVSSLSLAFVYPFWLYAEAVEVFSLHFLFIVLFLFISYSYHVTKKKSLLLLLSFLVGLSLTNNFTIVFAFPSIFVLVVSKSLMKQLTPKFMISLLLLFVLGLTPYLYLFYGSYYGPTISWKRIESISGFLHYVMRKDYGWGTDLQTGILFQNRVLALQSFSTYWLRNIPAVYFLLCALGMVFTLRTHKVLFLSLLSGIVFSAGFFLLYTGNTIGDTFILGTLEKFYGMPFVFTVPFFAFGVLFLQRFLATRLQSIVRSSGGRLMLKVGIVVACAVIPVSLFLKNVDRLYFRDLTIGDDHVIALLSTVPKNSILFLKSDTLHFNASYVQHAYNYRKDVLLATTPSLERFIEGNKRYKAMMTKIIKSKKYKEENDVLLATAIAMKHDRPIYTEKMIGIGIIDPRKEMIPYGLIYRLRNDGEKMSKDAFVRQQKQLFSVMHVDDVKRISNAENLPLLMMIIPYQYAQVYRDTGEYIISNYNDLKAAQYFFLQAHEVHLFDPSPLSALIRSHILLGECDEASMYIEKMQKIDSSQAEIYRKLLKNKKYCDV
jgi:hypothetical protein